MKRALILYASCGSGHRRAAEALAAAFVANGGDPRGATVRDVLDFVPDWYRRAYAGSYLGAVRRMPQAWGRLYRWSDARSLGDWRRRFLVGLDRLCASRALLDRILTAAPDVILTTHFLPMELLLTGGRPADHVPPLTCVVTDYRAHALWAIPGAALYAVGSEGAARDLQDRGISRNRIAVTGIPVDRRFVGLPAERPRRFEEPIRRILILSGGPGVGDPVSIVRALDREFDDLSIVVSAGTNDELHQRLESAAASLRTPVTVIGMVERIDRLFADSDLLITKPGGLTTTEAVVAGVPMILVPGIPGQEEGNANFFACEGAARRAASADDVVASLRRLRESRPLRRTLLRSLARVARPDATTEILRQAGVFDASEPRVMVGA